MKKLFAALLFAVVLMLGTAVLPIGQVTAQAAGPKTVNTGKAKTLTTSYKTFKGGDVLKFTLDKPSKIELNVKKGGTYLELHYTLYRESGKKISNGKIATTPKYHYDLEDYLFLKAGTYYLYAYSAYDQNLKRQTTIKSYDLRMKKTTISRSTTTIDFIEPEDYQIDMQIIKSAILPTEDKVTLKYKINVKGSGTFGFDMEMLNYTMKPTLKNSAGKTIALEGVTKGKRISCYTTKSIKAGTYYATVTVTRTAASKSKYIGDMFWLALGDWDQICELYD